jgi:uncharacterized membrane protein YgaE (UPF0421/DUF939 family)
MGRLRVSGRLTENAWLLLQSTAAAAAAWVIARYVFGHHEPFFAPVAAVIALNTSLGERGLNALRLVQGVLVGIAVGEVTLLALGSGTGSLVLATFAAMAIAVGFGGARVVIAQAAVGAILTVAIGEADAGLQRLADALIGAGVALVFTQNLGLLVLGSRGYGPVRSVLLGSVATRVISSAACPVMVVPRASSTGTD